MISRNLNGVADERHGLNIQMTISLILLVLLTWTGVWVLTQSTSLPVRTLGRFCSRFLNPGCEAADAFTVSWAGDYNWLFPSPYLVPCVLRHMLDGGENGILLVPENTIIDW